MKFQALVRVQRKEEKQNPTSEIVQHKSWSKKEEWSERNVEKKELKRKEESKENGMSPKPSRRMKLSTSLNDVEKLHKMR